jgi:hypothetical protein
VVVVPATPTLMIVGCSTSRRKERQRWPVLTG